MQNKTVIFLNKARLKIQRGNWRDNLTFELLGAENEMITRHLVFQTREIDPPAFHITTIVDPEDSSAPLNRNDNSCLWKSIEEASKASLHFSSNFINRFRRVQPCTVSKFLALLVSLLRMYMYLQPLSPKGTTDIQSVFMLFSVFVPLMKLRIK